MILYHFLSEKYGLENIERRRLKVARIMELNDPFEFLGVDLSIKEFRVALTETKKGMSKGRGIICFSNTWQNPVLWSHYADKHKGICLGFEVPDGPTLGKINYVDSRLHLPKDFADKLRSGKLTADSFGKLFTVDFKKEILHTKFSHWEYEEEYRLWVNLESCKRDTNGLRFIEFPNKQLKLTQVIVGAESDIICSQVDDALGSLNGSVEKFKARAAFKSFEIVRNIGKTW